MKNLYDAALFVWRAFLDGCGGAVRSVGVDGFPDIVIEGGIGTMPQFRGLVSEASSLPLFEAGLVSSRRISEAGTAGGVPCIAAVVEELAEQRLQRCLGSGYLFRCQNHDPAIYDAYCRGLSRGYGAAGAAAETVRAILKDLGQDVREWRANSSRHGYRWPDGSRTEVGLGGCSTWLPEAGQ